MVCQQAAAQFACLLFVFAADTFAPAHSLFFMLVPSGASKWDFANHLSFCFSLVQVLIISSFTAAV